MFEKVLEKIALALDEGRIRYMIIGGQAVLLHGEPRLTRAIDITLGATVEKLDVVLKLAKGIGLNPLVDPETFTRLSFWRVVVGWRAICSLLLLVPTAFLLIKLY